MPEKDWVHGRFNDEILKNGQRILQYVPNEKAINRYKCYEKCYLVYLYQEKLYVSVVFGERYSPFSPLVLNSGIDINPLIHALLEGIANLEGDSIE